MAAGLTAAQEYLHERQRRYPPRYARKSGVDRVRQLFAILRPGLPPALEAMVANGAVALGEVGHNVPDVRVLPAGRGQFVIEFTSGMMDFQYAVARALAGLDQRNAKLTAQPQSVDNVARLVGQVLRQWARYMRWHWLWPWRRIQWVDFPIAREAHNWIEMIVTMGELFLLAHELGHVALDSGLVKPVSGNSEADADRYGLEFLLPAAEKHWHKRIAYAGPIVPIRVLAALERLGVEFSEHYPPQAQRLELLRQQIFALCPSRQYFLEATTVMVAYQDMLDDIENHIDPSGLPALPGAERVLVRLIAELEEVAKGNVSLSTFTDNIGFIAKVVPHTTIRQATEMLVADYRPLPPPPGSFLGEALRTVMAATLDQLIAGLPSQLRPLFPP